MGSNTKSGKISKTGSTSPLSTLNSQPGHSAPARAAAISYDPEGLGVPVLAAFGEGLMAEKIISVAKESGVPILPDPTLSSMLSKVSVGDEIPEELYEAIAKVLVFVGEVDRKYSERIRAAVLK